MMQMASASFGSGNYGLQVGQSYAPINAEFHMPPERPETPPSPFATIPFSRDPDFVNRGDILDQIDQRCSQPAARVALVGLGGVGKSQLAIEYAHRIAERGADTWVFWVYAGTQARVEEGFRTIADTVKLPSRNQPKADIPQLVYRWLSNERNSRWVMILDSADDPDVFYNPTSGDTRNKRPFATCLPQSHNGSTIITTRNKELAVKLTGRHQNIIEVGPMAQTDALTLLQKKLGSLPDVDVAAGLVQALDLVPLAISQAAAYIQARAPRSSPKKYLAEFQESERKKNRLLEYDGGDLRRDGGASNAILTTWQISFDHIRSKRLSAANLLSLMSFFDRQGIPEWALKPSGIVKDIVPIPGRYHWCRYLWCYRRRLTPTYRPHPDSADNNIEDGFEDDVAMLRDYCLIILNEAGDEFEMHGLVQLSTRRWLEASGQRETFKQQYIKRMAALFPTGEYKNWATCRSLFAHVQVALDYHPSKDTAERWATLLHNGGWYAWSQGRYNIAQQMLDEARKTREKRLGRKDIATLTSTSMLATVLRDRGRWEEAEKLFVQNQGRWEEAEKLFVQVMETRKTKLGADHPDTLTSMANLAFTWKDQGRHTDALALMEECVQARQRVIGRKHPDTLSSLAAITEWRS
ncbi:Kinesin light chain [Madurella mycetomatis]|uniref:Kinesin light chain n=1 Tax=Madurella mycetomatis TaxID=100816 RepID=A0A175VYK1_9PEZI|nr:Kinesin light chain [Madurella mycetomatis]